MELPLDYGKPTTREKIGRAIKRSRNERFERELSFQIRAHGLPQPHEQYHFAAELGRKFRADFAWPQYKLLCEVHGAVWQRGGGGHSHPTGILKDIERYQIACLLGWFVVPVTTDHVRKGEAIALLERIFASRGWRR
jgi:very-short-patch-repair endonuclease